IADVRHGQRHARPGSGLGHNLWHELEPEPHAWLAGCLRRHVAGDWDDLDADDWAANDAAVRHRCGRLLFAYEVPVNLGEASLDRPVGVTPGDRENPTPAPTILWPSPLLTTPEPRFTRSLASGRALVASGEAPTVRARTAQSRHRAGGAAFSHRSPPKPP